MSGSFDMTTGAVDDDFNASLKEERKYSKKYSSVTIEHWYGYKRHFSVDMQSALINKVAVTTANTTDSKGFAFARSCLCR